MSDDKTQLLIREARKLLVETFGDMSTYDARSEAVHEIYQLLVQAGASCDE